MKLIFVSRIKNHYANLLKTHPIVINSLAYGSMFGLADSIQQVLTRKPVEDGETKPFNKARTLSYTIFGAITQGPLVTAWFTWIDNKYVGNSFKTTAKKLVLTQCTFSPLMFIFFFVCAGIMDKQENIIQETIETFPERFLISNIYWVPIQLINYIYISPLFRVTYNAACAFVWVNILFFIKLHSPNKNGHLT